MSWQDTDPHSNRAGLGAHGAYIAPHQDTLNGPRGGYSGYDPDEHELYGQPGHDFSRPGTGAGYDPNDPYPTHNGALSDTYGHSRPLPTAPGQAAHPSHAHGVYDTDANWDSHRSSSDKYYYNDDEDKKAYGNVAINGVEHYPADDKYMLDSSNDSGRDLELLGPDPPKRRGFWGRMFGNHIEEEGIQRIPEEDRSNKHLPGLLLLWWSVNSAVSTFPIGLLAQAYFQLSFEMAACANVVFTAIAAATCAYIATLGPQTGLRTIVLARYSVGYVGGTLFAILNILTQLGFSCPAVILGGQTLTNVSSGKIPLEASIVLVGFLALLLCFVGYQAVHYWERIAWVVQCALFACCIALGSKEGYRLEDSVRAQPTGREFAAGFLSYGGIVFSAAAGWAPVAADFNCRLPANTSKTLVFALTWFGITLPLVFIETLGSALMTVPVYAAAFETGDAGGVLARVFEPWHAGGKVILGIMAFSIVANVAPNTYSAALSAQILCPWFQKVPRAAWCVFMFVVYTAAAIGGREHLSEVLSNFLAILGYWVAFFVVVLIEEAAIFRRRIGWDLTAYDSFKKLPIGAAGIFACCCGIAGAVVSMAQLWYVGPIAAQISEKGGDLGFEISAAVTAIVYPPLRWLEIKYTGR